MRTRRSPGKDSSAAVKPDEDKDSGAKKERAETTALDPIDLDEEPAVEGTSSKAAEASSSAKANDGKSKARSARKVPPAIKTSTDLAKELFDDDDADDKAAAAAATAASNDSQSGDVQLVAPPRKRKRAGSDDSQNESQPSSSSFTTAVEGETAPRMTASDAASLQLRIRQLEMQLADSKAKADQSASIISAQHNIFQELHGQCICHICLEPAFRPNVLAPCGHVFCVHCLHSWFTKPRAGEATAPESWSQSEIERYQRSRTLKRKKICPSCRTELACPPVEVYLVRDMLEKVDEGLKLSKDADVVDSDMAESSNAILSVDDKVRLKGDDLPKGAKLWEDIFDQDGPRRIIFDEVDGVPRCGSCGSEILEGVCSNPSCEIEYDSHSDYEDLRRGGWDDVGDYDSDIMSDGDDDDDGEGGPRRPRPNGALRDRLADFEARHGPSEGLHRGNRLELPDDFSGITYIDSSDNEHMVQDRTEEMRRLDRRLGRRHDEDDEDDEDDMDGFIVDDDMDEVDVDDIIDDDDDRPNYFDGSDSEMAGSLADGYARYRDDEEDDFLPGPRRVGRAEAIEISDDEDEERDDRDSSVEYRGRRGGARFGSDDDDESSDRTDSASEEESAGRGGGLGSSTDSSVRRRRARIVDDDEDEDE